MLEQNQLRILDCGLQIQNSDAHALKIRNLQSTFRNLIYSITPGKQWHDAFDKDLQINTVETCEDLIKKRQDNADIQRILKGYLNRHPEIDLIEEDSLILSESIKYNQQND